MDDDGDGGAGGGSAAAGGNMSTRSSATRSRTMRGTPRRSTVSSPASSTSPTTATTTTTPPPTTSARASPLRSLRVLDAWLLKRVLLAWSHVRLVVSSRLDHAWGRAATSANAACVELVRPLRFASFRDEFALSGLRMLHVVVPPTASFYSNVGRSSASERELAAFHALVDAAKAQRRPAARAPPVAPTAPTVPTALTSIATASAQSSSSHVVVGGPPSYITSPGPARLRAFLATLFAHLTQLLQDDHDGAAGDRNDGALIDPYRSTHHHPSRPPLFPARSLFHRVFVYYLLYILHRTQQRAPHDDARPMPIALPRPLWPVVMRDLSVFACLPLQDPAKLLRRMLREHAFVWSLAYPVVPYLGTQRTIQLIHQRAIDTDSHIVRPTSVFERVVDVPQPVAAGAGAADGARAEREEEEDGSRAGETESARELRRTSAPRNVGADAGRDVAQQHERRVGHADVMQALAQVPALRTRLFAMPIVVSSSSSSSSSELERELEPSSLLLPSRWDRFGLDEVASALGEYQRLLAGGAADGMLSSSSSSSSSSMDDVNAMSQSGAPTEQPRHDAVGESDSVNTRPPLTPLQLIDALLDETSLMRSAASSSSSSSSSSPSSFGPGSLSIELVSRLERLNHFVLLEHSYPLLQHESGALRELARVDVEYTNLCRMDGAFTRLFPTIAGERVRRGSGVAHERDRVAQGRAREEEEEEDEERVDDGAAAVDVDRDQVDDSDDEDGDYGADDEDVHEDGATLIADSATSAAPAAATPVPPASPVVPVAAPAAPTVAHVAPSAADEADDSASSWATLSSVQSSQRALSELLRVSRRVQRRTRPTSPQLDPQYAQIFAPPAPRRPRIERHHQQR